MVKHYMDTDGDGVFNKKNDDMIIKGRAPSSFSLSDAVGEASSILGDAGTTYIHGLQYIDGLDDFKNYIGLAPDVEKDLGFWDTVDHGITTLGNVVKETLNVECCVWRHQRSCWSVRLKPLSNQVIKHSPGFQARFFF